MGAANALIYGHRINSRRESKTGDEIGFSLMVKQYVNKLNVNLMANELDISHNGLDLIEHTVGENYHLFKDLV